MGRALRGHTHQLQHLHAPTVLRAISKQVVSGRRAMHAVQASFRPLLGSLHAVHARREAIAWGVVQLLTAHVTRENTHKTRLQHAARALQAHTKHPAAKRRALTAMQANFRLQQGKQLVTRVRREVIALGVAQLSPGHALRGHTH